LILRTEVASLPDSTLDHLRKVLDLPDLSSTRYELIEEIGRGGMGTVYLARDAQLGRSVALKVVNAIAPGTEMLTEARALAYLEHPGIVPVHDAGALPDGRFYYAMKLVRGPRLDEYARENPPLADALRVFLRVCETAAFAHSQGVVHCDLKPENIMVGSFGEVLVLDWGVAKWLRDAEPGRDAIVGTREYMAPEQAAGAADERSDVFSLGKVLAFLIEPSSPKPLMAITQKAAALDRAQRYASAGDLAADIARYLAREPVLAYREPLYERAARLLARHKTLVSLLAAYLIARVVIFFLTRR
jgi:serine/threonine protein kinase